MHLRSFFLLAALFCLQTEQAAQTGMMRSKTVINTILYLEQGWKIVFKTFKASRDRKQAIEGRFRVSSWTKPRVLKLRSKLAELEIRTRNASTVVLMSSAKLPKITCDFRNLKIPITVTEIKNNWTKWSFLSCLELWFRTWLKLWLSAVATQDSLEASPYPKATLRSTLQSKMRGYTLCKHCQMTPIFRLSPLVPKEAAPMPLARRKRRSSSATIPYLDVT